MKEFCIYKVITFRLEEAHIGLDAKFDFSDEISQRTTGKNLVVRYYTGAHFL